MNVRGGCAGGVVAEGVGAVELGGGVAGSEGPTTLLGDRGGPV
jgi:hypothetical protein